jgi:hypothetical protein
MTCSLIPAELHRCTGAQKPSCCRTGPCRLDLSAFNTASPPKQVPPNSLQLSWVVLSHRHHLTNGMRYASHFDRPDCDMRQRFHKTCWEAAVGDVMAAKRGSGWHANFVACFFTVARLQQISVRHGTKKRMMTSPSLVAGRSSLGAGLARARFGHWLSNS